MASKTKCPYIGGKPCLESGCTMFMATPPIPLLKTARELGVSTFGAGICCLTAGTVLALESVKRGEGMVYAVETLRNEVAQPMPAPMLEKINAG